MAQERAADERARRTTRASYTAPGWVVLFFALHVYWYLGGAFGSPGSLPGGPHSLVDWIFDLLVAVTFPLGACLAIAYAAARGMQVMLSAQPLEARVAGASPRGSEGKAGGCHNFGWCLVFKESTRRNERSCQFTSRKQPGHWDGTGASTRPTTALLADLAGDRPDAIDWSAIAVVLQAATTHCWLLTDLFGRHPTGAGQGRFVAGLAALTVAVLNGSPPSRQVPTETAETVRGHPETSRET